MRAGLPFTAALSHKWVPASIASAGGPQNSYLQSLIIVMNDYDSTMLSQYNISLGSSTLLLLTTKVNDLGRPLLSQLVTLQNGQILK